MNTDPIKPFGTLELIRQISESESLTEEAVIELATYLNEREAARQTWPGNMLFDFFVNVYEDGNVRLYELEALALIIQAIMIHTDGMAAEAVELEPEAIDEELADPDVILVPALGVLDEQGYNAVPGCPEMYFETMQCDCLDWQTARRKLPPNSPGRFCKHLCRALSRHLELLPKSATHLGTVVDWAGKFNRALPPLPIWRVAIQGASPVIAAWGAGYSCEIYAPGESGVLDGFSYNLRESQWSSGKRPKNTHDPKLKAFLAERVAEFSGRTLLGTSK